MEKFEKLTIEIDEKVKELFEKNLQLQKEMAEMNTSFGIVTRSRTNSMLDTADDCYSAIEDSGSDTNDSQEDLFFEENYWEIVEMVHELMDDYTNTYLLQMKDPKFHENMIRELGLHIRSYFDSIALESINSSRITEEIIENMPALYDCFVSSNLIPPRSSTDVYTCYMTHDDSSIEYLKNQIALLECAEQPEQRTPEWYVFRHNLISASNLWKVFGTPAMQNSLIYEKCKPL